MPHAMIFDAVRTPRGKGKKDGSLHEVKPVDLLAGLLAKLQQRHDFDPAQLDDWRTRIDTYLCGRRLRLQPDKTLVTPTAQPQPFLGFELLPDAFGLDGLHVLRDGGNGVEVLRLHR